MSSWVYDPIKTIVEGSVLSLQYTCQDIQKILSLSETTNNKDVDSIIAAMNQVTSTLNGAMKDTILPGLISAGWAIAFFFFIISMVELINQERLTMEMFVKFFGKLVIGIAFVYYSKDIFIGIVKLGDAFGTEVGKLFKGVTKELHTVKNLKDSLKTLCNSVDGNVFKEIGLLLSVFFSLFPCYIIAFVVQLLSYIIAFTRLIEMYARGSMLPIACALMTDDGWRGTGGSYIKKFIAICCQSAILIAIAGISSVAFQTVSEKVFATIATNSDVTIDALSSGIGIMCAIGISMVSVMFKSISIVNDAFGAR